MSQRLKVLCFHPALAPYRLDFFNRLAELVDLEVVFHQTNLQNQKFGQERLLSAAQFRYRFETCGFNLRSRIFRWGTGRILRETKPDVVLSYESSPNVMELIFRRAFGSRWQLWTSMDDNAGQIRTRTGLRKFLRDFVLRHVDGVVVPSEVAGCALRACSSSQARVAVVPIVHDTSKMRANEAEVIRRGREWRTQVIPRAWEKVLLFVGRLTKVKNIPWLLKQLKTIESNIGLVLIGSGDQEQELHDLVKKEGLGERVLFAGRKEGDDLYACMSASDTLILPSTFEPYGAVVGEALQWGTPCLVSEHVGAKTLIHAGRNGEIINLSDAGAFQGSLRRCAELKRGCESLLGVDLQVAVRDLVTEWGK